eukprot:1160449-Pelagomonas_calceolata.AAC.17
MLCRSCIVPASHVRSCTTCQVLHLRLGSCIKQPAHHTQAEVVPWYVVQAQAAVVALPLSGTQFECVCSLFECKTPDTQFEYQAAVMASPHNVKQLGCKRRSKGVFAASKRMISKSDTIGLSRASRKEDRIFSGAHGHLAHQARSLAKHCPHNFSLEPGVTITCKNSSKSTWPELSASICFMMLSSSSGEICGREDLKQHVHLKDPCQWLMGQQRCCTGLHRGRLEHQRRRGAACALGGSLLVARGAAKEMRSNAKASFGAPKVTLGHYRWQGQHAP